MRKTCRIIPMLFFAIIATSTTNIFAPYRHNKTPQRFVAKKQQPMPVGGGPASKPTTTTKTEAQKKQELANLENKKIPQATKQLTDAVKQEKEAQTPEEKAAAKKKIVEEAKEVIKIITAERNLQGELLGYSKEEIEEANAVLSEQEAKRDALQKIVNDFKKKQRALQVEGWKGWMLGSVKPGKEKEYEKITKEINTLEPVLTELNTAIRNQSIIAGKQKFTKSRAVAGAALGTALTATGLYLYLGPIAAKMEYDNFKNDPRGYLTNRATSFKTMVSGLLSSTTTQQAMLDATGTALNETWTQYVLKQFGQGTLAIVNVAFAITKDIVWQATVGAVVTQAVMKLQTELMALLKDPKATKEQIEEKAQQIEDTKRKALAKAQKKQTQ